MPASLSKIASKEDEDGKEKDIRKDKLLQTLYLNTFQAVVQHVIILQSEQHLFQSAFGGDAARSTRALSTTTAIVGALGLTANQLAGRLSDAYGRRPFFHIGPLVNIAMGLLVFRLPKSRLVLTATRVLKMVSTTLSGTVMGSAAISDTLSGNDMAIAGAKFASCIGIAVITAPFMESAILKVTKGSHRFTYLALSLMAFWQLVSVNLRLPETLRAPIPFNLRETLESLNPFDSFRLFRSRNRTLKQLIVIGMLQMLLDGKNVSDFSQVWMREHLKWSPTSIRNQTSWYGFWTTLSGLIFVPLALKNTSVIGFTTVANIGMALGYMPSLFSMSGTLFTLSIFPQLVGVNGASLSALAPVFHRCAAEEGFGRGQFAAYMSNLRAVPAVLGPICVGALYEHIQRKKLNAGVVFPTIGFFGAILPTLLLWTVVDKGSLRS